MTAPAADTWQQADIGLGHQGDGPTVHARHCFEVFTDAIPPELRDQWFFQRKPPDIRLRFRRLSPTRTSPTGDGEVRSVINGAITPLLESGVIRSFTWGEYVPETARFGGAAAIAVAHRHFCRDTELWRNLSTLTADETTRALLSHQLLTAIDAASPRTIEAQSVWHRLLDLLDASLPVQAGGTPPSPSTMANVALTRTAADIVDLANRSDRHINITNLAALLIHFDCNRWGVDGTRQRAIALDALGVPHGHV